MAPRGSSGRRYDVRVPTLRVPAILLALACAALQYLAYSASALTATHPYECIAIPHGDCWHIMASGYADVLHFAGARWNVEAMVAIFVPLWMWIAVVCAVQAPFPRSHATIAYVVALALTAGIGAMQLRGIPGPEPVPLH